MTPQVLLTIPTLHLEASISFYLEVLGFTLKERMDRPNGVVLAFLEHPCGFTVEFVAGPVIPVGEVGPGAPLLTFLVEDFEDISARLDRSGHTERQRIELPGGISMLRFRDPNGVLLSFVSGAL